MILKNKATLVSIIILICISSTYTFGQDLRINEAVASNSNTIIDEDGDTPDWLEISNLSDNTINLENYKLSDTSVDPDYWVFPSYDLLPDQHLLIFASGKDKKDLPTYWETVIDIEEEWHYLIPESEPSDTWRTLAFDDSEWLTGNSGFGYGDNDDNTDIGYANSIYLRKSFALENLSTILQMILHIDYDDGFIAYINGTEVARAGLTGDFPTYNSFAELHEASIYTGGNPETFTIDTSLINLNTGDNIICIQVHNANEGSSDMTMIPILSIANTENNNATHTEYLNNAIASFHTNFKISSSGDSLFLTGPDNIDIDTLLTGTLNNDISIGYNGTNNLVYFESPTPGAANTTDGFSSISEQVSFSMQSGVFTSSINVEITPSINVYYTMDGREPTTQDNSYSEAITVNSNTVLRARIIEDNKIHGPVATGSYFVNTSHDVAIVSIAVNPDDFFDYETGIYERGADASPDFPHFGANFWNDWERKIHITMIEKDGDIGFEANAGVKIFGAYSRGNDQKSLAVYFRKSYGDGPIDYKLFKEKDLKEYSSITLRNSGNDWNNTMLRDGVMSSLFDDSIDKQGFRQAVLYINGEYWGIHNIREKINEHFLADNHDIDSDSLEIIEVDGIPVMGSPDHYREMITYLEDRNTLSNDDISYLGTQMDISNFLYYQSGNIYINNTDWPGNNIKCWRPTQEGGKWKWISYDRDFGFGTWSDQDHYNNTLEFALATNGPNWPNPPWSTLILRKLMTNDQVKQQFVNIMADQLNTTWIPELVVDNIEGKASEIENEIKAHATRWNGSTNYWYSQINVMKTFANNRPKEMRRHIQNVFQLSGNYELTLTVNNNSFGAIRVNSVHPTITPWTGIYFDDVTVDIEAIPNPGHRFVRWERSSLTTSIIQQSFDSDTALTAVFEEEDNELNDIIINEIFYNSDEEFDAMDWVELYNKGVQSVNISQWILKDDDDNHQYIIPDNTIIEAGTFLILCQSKENFQDKYDANIPNIGNFEFGLSGNGDCIRLYNSQEELAEQVCYLTEAPWPISSDGEGSSLGLGHPDYDNQDGNYWYDVENHGSPGQPNEKLIDITDPTLVIDSSLKNEFNIYPNPFNSQINITNDRTILQVIVTDLLGHRIESIQQSSSENSISWRPKDTIQNGIYILLIETQDGWEQKRIVHLK
ncbi:MAG: CotH kinase family protein [Reichenbachiella sp.]